MGLLIGWVVASIAIGLVARARRDAFWPAFAFALVLSPLVGFALTMLKLPDPPQAEGSPASPSPSPSPSGAESRTGTGTGTRTRRQSYAS